MSVSIVEKLLIAIGVWILSDGLYSILVYLRRDDQDLLTDHSIRIFRSLLGIILITVGWIGIKC